MAGVRFTKDQQSAIDTLDKSILVSAAAGSGKTAVLIERIINIIIQGNANVDEMLVVTFTNAAAAEMKLKLTKAIKKKIAADPSSQAKMQLQLDRMYRSYISTFHSFAIRLIREFFYKIDMEPNFQICDEVQAKIFQLEAVDELFEEGFANDDFIDGCSFTEFLRLYSDSKGDDKLKQSIIGSYSKLRSMPNYMAWANDKAELLNAGDDYTSSPIYTMMCGRVVDQLAAAYESGLQAMEMLVDSGNDRMAEAIRPEVEKINELAELVGSEGLTQELRDAITGFKAVTLRVTNKDNKESYGEIKEDIKALRENYKDIRKNGTLSLSLDTQFAELTATYKYAKYYLGILARFEELFSAKKQERNLLDFGDIEHIATRILEDPEVAEIVRKRFKYIFIDEYQDTNKIQEYLISRFARPDNVFKVGDVKQSIYGFRQSDPKIFLRTREDYMSEANPDAVTIDLNMNFRSNSRTIDYINAVFENVMEGYDDKAKLYNGLSTIEPYDYEPEVHYVVMETGESDEQGKPVKDRDAEAEHVARVVKSIIGTEFYDSSQGVVRKATPRDIVILMRSVSNNAPAYYKAMLEHNIVAHVDDSEGFFDNVEIEVAMALLRVIDNMRQDIPLIAVLRSEIFGFTTEELAEIRATYAETGMRGSYYNAFVHYINTATGSLALRAAQARDRIKNWKKLSDMMSLSEFVWHVLTESGYYLYAGSMYGGRQRQANLRVLAERAMQFQDTGIATLGGFIRYMDLIKSRKVKSSQAILVGTEDDVVRIMTIHKSKGLEFPFVIVAGLSKKLMYDNLSREFAVDSDIGISIPYVNRESRYWRPTIMQRLIIDKSKDEGVEEEQRLFYVALTRARQKLIMTCTIDNREALESIKYSNVAYLNIFGKVLSNEFGMTKIYDAEAIQAARQSNMLVHFIEKRRRLNAAGHQDIYKEVYDRLSYEYPDKEALETKAKYSVSEIRTRNLGEDAAVKYYLNDPEFTAVREVNGAEVGTGYHRIMEAVEFDKVLITGSPDADYIKAVADELNSTGAIDDRVYAKIKLSKIEAFFNTDVGRRAAAAQVRGQLYKEKPFTMKSTVDGRDVLVQGIIDCCFVEDGKYILVDYKSNFVKDFEEIEAMYQEQISLYKKALELGTGSEVTECYLYLFNRDTAIQIIT